MRPGKGLLVASHADAGSAGPKPHTPVPNEMHHAGAPVDIRWRCNYARGGGVERSVFCGTAPNYCVRTLSFPRKRHGLRQKKLVRGHRCLSPGHEARFARSKESTRTAFSKRLYKVRIVKDSRATSATATATSNRTVPGPLHHAVAPVTSSLHQVAKFVRSGPA